MWSEKKSLKNNHVCVFLPFKSLIFIGKPFSLYESTETVYFYKFNINVAFFCLSQHKLPLLYAKTITLQTKTVISICNGISQN